MKRNYAQENGPAVSHFERASLTNIGRPLGEMCVPRGTTLKME